MPTEGEFIRRLSGFGLSEKEAVTYIHLLKYGLKAPSRLMSQSARFMWMI
jgi:sugar-specific transcriptional regulator TrmB